METHWTGRDLGRAGFRAAQTPLTIQASRLYTLFDSDDYGTHLLRIQIPKAGLKAFTFSFG
jgi:hypothetical protein